MTDKELLYHDLCHRLPHGVEYQYLWNGVLNQQVLSHNSITFIHDHLDIIKPILRPLSDLTKPIEHKGERFVPEEWLNEEYAHFIIDGDGNKKWIGDWIIESIVEDEDIDSLPYGTINKLIEWHFDINGLIDKGLAIDVNTLTTNCYA